MNDFTPPHTSEPTNSSTASQTDASTTTHHSTPMLSDAVLEKVTCPDCKDRVFREDMTTMYQYGRVCWNCATEIMSVDS